MPANRLVPREEEPLVFRPIPGSGDLWAGEDESWIRDPVWDRMGLYPLCFVIIVYLGLLGLM